MVSGIESITDGIILAAVKFACKSNFDPKNALIAWGRNKFCI
jgi:hypothetical protein